MTSWFNLIVSNRIIRGNKLPKWGVPPAKSFNNDGNHGHDVSRRYFIIGFLASASVGRASARARRAARLTHSCSCRPSPHSPGSLRGRAASWPRRAAPPAAADGALLPDSIPSSPNVVGAERRRFRTSFRQERCLSCPHRPYLPITMCYYSSRTLPVAAAAASGASRLTGSLFKHE